MRSRDLARAGDNIVSGTDLYGGTWNLFANTLRDMGIEVRFVDPADPQAFVAASDDRTRAWYVERCPIPSWSSARSPNWQARAGRSASR